jgi:hypothetical protein
MFYIFVGLEILTKKCSNTSLSFYLSHWAFHLNACAIRLSHEVGVIAGPVAFQSDYGQRIT